MDRDYRIRWYMNTFGPVMVSATISSFVNTGGAMSAVIWALAYFSGAWVQFRADHKPWEKKP